MLPTDIMNHLPAEVVKTTAPKQKLSKLESKRKKATKAKRKQASKSRKANRR